MTLLFIDIETIPTQRPEEMARIAAEALAHNSDLAKPKSDEDLARIVDETHRKTALDGAWAEVLCVCVGQLGFDGIPPTSSRWAWGTWGKPSAACYRECVDERDMLRDLFCWFDGIKAPTLVGHNVIGFDLPILRQRAMVHGLVVPPCIARTVKPWDAVEVDTMAMWTGGQAGKTISLDKLCRALGVEGKGDGMNGGKVYDAWLEGRINEIVEYCDADVRRTIAVYERMAAAL